MGSVRLEKHTIGFEQSGEGPPLLLLHGIGSNRTSWSHQFKDLGSDFTLIAWDAPGYGLSSDPIAEPPTMAEYTDCLKAFIDVLDIGPVHLLGHSMGGIIAQEFYRRHSEGVKTLILANTTRGGKAEPEQVRTRKLEDRLGLIQRLTARQLAEERTPRLFSQCAKPSVVRDAISIMAGIRPSGYRYAATAMSGADERDLLGKITVPTLLIWAAEDHVIPSAEADQMRRAIPDVQFEVIPQAGHLCYQERPGRFNALIRQFCLAHS